MIPKNFIKDQLSEKNKSKDFSQLTENQQAYIKIKWHIYNRINARKNQTFENLMEELADECLLSEGRIRNIIYEKKFLKIRY